MLHVRLVVMSLALALLTPLSALRIGLAANVARRGAPAAAQLRTAAEPLAVEPLKLVRLLNSVYGAEQMLLFRLVGDDDEESKLLPTLLAFDQASALESELGGGGEAGGLFASLAGVDLGLAGKLLARTDFFEAAAERRMGPLEVAQKARGARGVADAMAKHLASCGLEPRSVALGTAAEEQERAAVGMRDMGAQTPAAPSSVRLTAQLPATLLCEAGGARQVFVPLGGAADAVMLARLSAGSGTVLPLLVSSALWDVRAVAPERLPETTVEQNCTFEGCPA